MFDNVEDMDMYRDGSIKADWPDALAVYVVERDGGFDLKTVKLPDIQSYPDFKELINDQQVLKDMIEHYTGDKVADHEHIDVLAKGRMN